jgi:hypothetical protein
MLVFHQTGVSLSRDGDYQNKNEIHKNVTRGALFRSTSEALRNQHVLYTELSAILFLKNARRSLIQLLSRSKSLFEV